MLQRGSNNFIIPHSNFLRSLYTIRFSFIQVLISVIFVFSSYLSAQTITSDIVTLKPVATGITAITEIVFFPNSNDQAMALSKAGELYWVNTLNQTKRIIHTFKVRTQVEEGLLGLVFAPNFKQSSLIYVHYSTGSGNRRIGRISEFQLNHSNSMNQASLSNERILIEVDQPFANHNGGHLEFGPDGYLYIGLGDGGSFGDPHNNGQNYKTWLGSMLRIDIRPTVNANQKVIRPYSIPIDNPSNQSGHSKWLPEIYAIGLRNPWKFSFAKDGRLIAADVGQDLYEEISIIRKGENYGWNFQEGFHCYQPKQNCQTNGLTEPIYEYSHSEGRSITGGYVYYGSKIKQLKNKYVFADFVTGFIRAIDLPYSNQRVTHSLTVAKTNMLISTFGQSSDSELYLGDYKTGTIYKLIAK